MITITNYYKPKTLEEAYELNQKRTNRIIGGMLWMKMQDSAVHTAIDLSDLGLDTIEETDDTISIGAMVTLRQLEFHQGLSTYSGDAVAAAVRDIVGVQFRNMATVGGSIWGRFGFSDVLTVFLSMDCEVELFHGGLVPLSTFVSMPYDNDLLIRILIHKTPGKFVYTAMRNQRTDFPVLTCASSVVDGQYRTVIGARPDKAMLFLDEAGLLAGGINDASAKAFAAHIAANCKTGSNTRGSSAYRTHLIQVLTERNLMKLGGDC